MTYNKAGGFPQQQLSFSRKNRTWRKQCVDYGDNYSYEHYNPTVKSVHNMQINYDLLNGKIHMSDMKLLVNPYGIDASFIPDNIQHYSIINSKLNVLRGEESERLFDPRVVVTNPSAITEMEEEKNKQIIATLQQLLMDNSQNEEEYQQELNRLSDYFAYNYQDKREIRGNLFLSQYMKEHEIPQLFNKGFVDVEAVGMEAYQCDIVSGEPVVDKLDPRKMRILRSGYSEKIEDADMIILEDYWSLGKVYDIYWDQLSKKDIEELESVEHDNGGYTDNMDNIDSRFGWVRNPAGEWVAGDAEYNTYNLFDERFDTSLTPYDINGNIRVLRVYWKSRRKIKKVKSYDPETGDEQFNFYPETYHAREELGEEEQVFWVNEAWEGTKIGKDIYVNMRPRPVQYNRLSNPSKCHFGIIGSIYSINGEEPFSMVDIMKPYAYLYDMVHDRLNKLLAKNLGKIVRMDLAKVPKGWDVDKWMYYITVNGIAVEDSFKEGNIGAAQGKLAGGLNNASNGVIDASQGNEIQFNLGLLESIRNVVGELAGISRQREGQISNRETVGGVERATLQSSHITKWLFFIHESVKRRTLECLLETAKIAYKGRKIKFYYILDDGSRKLTEMDGDEFAECDYGLVVDTGDDVQQLNQSLGQLAQAALQNNKMNFSTLMKIYTTKSIAEKQRLIERYEQKIEEQQMQAQQQQQQQFQMQLQQQAEIENAKAEREYQMHQEELENKILVAQINSRAEELRMSILNHDNDEANTIEREKMAEEARQFDKKLAFDEKKLKADTEVKKEQIRKKTTK